LLLLRKKELLEEKNIVVNRKVFFRFYSSL